MHIFPQEGVLCMSLRFPPGAKPHIPPRNESRRDWRVEKGTIHGKGATVRMEMNRIGTAFKPSGA